MLNNHSQTDVNLIRYLYLTMIIQNLNINIHKNIFACLLFIVCNIICLLVKQVSLMRQCFEGYFSNH